jgi:hypothetical protein
VIAKQVNPAGKGPLNLMVGMRMKGARGGLSYTGPEQQATPFQDPWKAYKEWATAGQNPSDPAMLDRTALRRRSVLDLVKTEFDALKNQSVLSQQDRTKLDLHFSSIRDVEVHMAAAGLAGCGLPEARGKEACSIATDLAYPIWPAS